MQSGTPKTRSRTTRGGRQAGFMTRLFVSPQFMIAVLMMAFGVILISHIKSVRSDETIANLAERYIQRQAEFEQAEQLYQTLLAENDRLSKQKTQAVADLLNSQGYDQLLSELEHIQILAGFTEVHGPGVVLTLNDKPDFDIAADSLESIVHDGDLRHAFDLLKAAGAAGFSVNGLRITNASFISCIGSTILCNQQRMTPPYVITALGNPRNLAEAILGDPEFVARQGAPVSLQVQVVETAQVVLPPFAEADDFFRYIDLLEVAGP